MFLERLVFKWILERSEELYPEDAELDPGEESTSESVAEARL